MYKNIGKRIRLLAVILAILTLVGCLAMAAVFVAAAIRATDETMTAAGIEGAILFAVLALTLPFLTWILYGFGTLVENAERQVEQSREIRELLKKSLADGALSEEIARKTGSTVGKLVTTVAPAPRAGVAPTRPVLREEAAPAPAVQVPVTPPPVTAPPAKPTPVPAEASPAPKAEAPTAAPMPKAQPVPPAATPFTPADNDALSPLRNFGSEETY